MHRSHDYRHLIARWRAVCQQAGLRLRKLATADGYLLYYVETPVLREKPGLYVSAGIHGDEPGGAEGLITWAESRAKELRELPLLLLPCLNPWGLINNVRVDAEGRDLNRCFHHDEIPMIAGWKTLMRGRRFKAALALHEDYDGEGLYLYEVPSAAAGWGELLLKAARPVIPIENRARVDNFAAVAGVIRPRLRKARFKKIGYPEAVLLHLEHSEWTYTVETPSEFALEARAAAHRAVIEKTLHLAGLTRRRK